MTTTTWTKTTEFGSGTYYTRHDGMTLQYEDAGSDSAWVIRTPAGEQYQFNGEIGADDVAAAKAWAETVA